MNETSHPVDLSRLSRPERRKYQKRTGIKIMGRNMPYIKKIHGSIEEYNTLRDAEIRRDIENK